MRSSLLLVPLMILLIVGLIYSFVTHNGGMPGYAGEDPSIDLTADAKAARARLARTLEGVTHSYSDFEWTEKELRDVVLVGLSRHKDGQRILEMSEGLSTRLSDGKLQVGVKVNFDDMIGDLNEEERKMFDRAVLLAPMAEGRDVFLGFQSVPEIEEGQLKLDPRETTASVAVVKMPLDVLVERLGKKKRDVDELFSFKIPGYRFGDMRLEEKGVNVKVRKS